MKNATVNWNSGFDDVCKEKQVSIAYNNEHEFFYTLWDYANNRQMEEMMTNEAIPNEDEICPSGYQCPYPIPITPYVKISDNIARAWEIQAAFFETNNIRPQWHWAHYEWGTLNYTTGQWSGAVGLIQRDEVDYAVNDFAFTHARSKVVTLSPGVIFSPLYLFTRYPQELSPTWNLIGLFTKGYKSQNLQS